MGGYLCNLVVVHAEPVLHEVVRLAHDLHVTVLDPVVDHLHKVTRALRPDL